MTDPTPTRDEAVREHTDRYHKHPFTGFAPRDEKRRKQVVSLPMDVLLAIFRERLAYLQHGSDLDAVAQFVACEIERAMGVFPNLDGAVPAPASGGVDAVLDLYREAVRVDVKMEGPQFMGANSSALKRAWEADRASLSPAATPVSEAEPVAFPADGELLNMEDGERANAFWRWSKAAGLPLHMAESGLNRFHADDRAEWAWQAWCAALSPAATPVSEAGGGRRVRHKKRGGIYEVLGEAQVQTSRPLEDYEVVVIYRSLNTPDIDDPASPMKGDTWIRPKAEFNDGRFEELSQSTSAGRVGE